jgi:hypothetical protein
MAQAVELFHQGYSWRDIGPMLGKPWRTIYGWARNLVNRNCLSP